MNIKKTQNMLQKKKQLNLLLFLFFITKMLTNKTTEIKTLCFIGAGYVGGTTGAVFADKCPDIKVIVVDNNKEKIDKWNGEILPIYEKGLNEIVKRNRNRKLFFTTEIKEAVKSSDIIFVCVNTPTKDYGVGKGTAYDLRILENAIKTIMEHATTNKIIVEKSTVPCGTGEKIKKIINKTNKRNIDIQVLSNPEFLAQGTAIRNLINPDRVLIGSSQDERATDAENILAGLYQNWVPSEKIIKSSMWSSELGKIASNALLAQKLSSINSLAELCEKTGANIEEVAQIVGSDKRIGPAFLKPAFGFGGSCFEKDILSLVYLYEKHLLNLSASYWRMIIEINNHQKKIFFEKIFEQNLFGIADKKITVLGFAFKKGTSDPRNSPAEDLIRRLIKERAQVQIYDPMVEPRQIMETLSLSDEEKKFLTFFDEIYEACKDTDTLVFATEWEVFTELDFSKIYSLMKKPALVFDGKNILNRKYLESIGFDVHSIGNH